MDKAIDTNSNEDKVFSDLARAAGAYMAVVADGAIRSAPDLASQADALLKSGVAFTRVVVEMAGPAVKVAALIVSVSDGRELMSLGQCEAIAHQQH